MDNTDSSTTASSAQVQINAGDDTAMAALASQVDNLSDQSNKTSGFSIANLASAISIGIAAASIILLLFQRIDVDKKIAEMQGQHAFAMTNMTRQYRGLVAGAGTGQPPPPEHVDITIADNVPRLGSKDAKVTIVEYSDFQCPYCHRFYEEVLPQLKKEYIDTGKASFVYQNFAFLGEESKQAAEASLCAKEQGKYWEFHDALFEAQSGENQGAFSDKKIKELAAKLKLKTANFNSCLDSGKYAAQVDAENEAGRSFGVSGTPTTFVNGWRIVGAQGFDAFKVKIEEELAK